MEEVTKDSFQREVIESKKPVVLDFWGPQCGPCIALMPQVEAMASGYGDKIRIAKVEAPKNRRLCIELKVMALPTFLFFKDGKEVDRLTNTVTAEAIEASISKLLE
jgi:thioredoxin 1